MVVFGILEMRESASPARNKAAILITMLIIITVFSYPVYGIADNGILTMQIFKPGFTPMEQFSIKCFYNDIPNNVRRDDTWSVLIPNEASKKVRLKLDRNLKTETPSKMIPVLDPGPVTSWDVKPNQRGKYKLILEYYINEDGPYKLTSDYIQI